MPITFDELQQRLKVERDRLLRQLEQLRASAPAVGEMKEGSPYGKKEEGASEAFELEKRLAVEKRLMGTLSEIEHALRKFEKGTYGTCDTCGRAVEIGACVCAMVSVGVIGWHTMRARSLWLLGSTFGIALAVKAGSGAVLVPDGGAWLWITPGALADVDEETLDGLWRSNFGSVLWTAQALNKAS